MLLKLLPARLLISFVDICCFRTFPSARTWSIDATSQTFEPNRERNAPPRVLPILYDINIKNLHWNNGPDSSVVEFLLWELVLRRHSKCKRSPVQSRIRPNLFHFGRVAPSIFYFEIEIGVLWFLLSATFCCRVQCKRMPSSKPTALRGRGKTQERAG